MKFMKDVTKTVNEVIETGITNNDASYVIDGFDISGYRINPETSINLKIEKALAYDKELIIDKSYSFKFGSVE